MNIWGVDLKREALFLLQSTSPKVIHRIPLVFRNNPIVKHTTSIAISHYIINTQHTSVEFLSITEKHNQCLFTTDTSSLAHTVFTIQIHYTYMTVFLRNG